MRRCLVVANWKMNSSNQAKQVWAETFTSFLELPAEMVVCAPYVYLADLATRLLASAINMNVGAQDCSRFKEGAYTGEVGASMIADIGVPWVIIGHSERRQLFGDTNEIVAEKAVRAIEAGLRPIICVGESLEQRQAGETQKVIGEQLQAVLKAIGAQNLSNGALAYEPIWAIGTGNTATPGQAQEVHKFLRNSVKSLNPEAAENLRILYGGSVKPSNAAELFDCPDIDGGLVGGASLNVSDFYAIAQACAV